MSKDVGLFYGSTTGNTESCAELIATHIGPQRVDMHELATAGLSHRDLPRTMYHSQIQGIALKSNDQHHRKRYKAVIEAFDEYIEPMLEMVDIRGDFHACFTLIEQQISTQIDPV